MNDAERKLLVLAAQVIEQHRNDGYPGDVDGGWMQEKMLELGIIIPVPVSEPCDPENCRCAEYGDFPTDCYRYEAMVSHTLKNLETPARGRE